MVNLNLITYEDYESLSKKVEALENKILQLLDKSQQEKKKDYLTVKEFMAEIGISRTSFENLRRESHPGKFRVNVIKRGGKVYIPSSELERYFQHK